MASSAVFLENWRKVNRSSTWTSTAFVVSDSFFSAARFYHEFPSRFCHKERVEVTDLLSTQHLRIRSLGVLQECFVNSRLRLEFAESLNAGHDTFVGVLVNLDRDKLGLTNADDRGHDQHGLAAKTRQHGKKRTEERQS